MSARDVMLVDDPYAAFTPEQQAAFRAAFRHWFSTAWPARLRQHTLNERPDSPGPARAP